MALTTFQRTVCRLIAQQRIASGESYVAGGTARNAMTGAPRISRDVDLFHDTAEAVRVTFAADRQLLTAEGYRLSLVRERESFIEAMVERDHDRVMLQWTADSAYRFFPLMRHEDFGLTLHPLDLATNKVLALVGRLEVRDWVDVIHAHAQIQPLGYLAWAACGKDPGFSPQAILEQAGRSGRYSATEVAELAFSGPAPDAATLARQWHQMLDEARAILNQLPSAEAGKCVLDAGGKLFRGSVDEIPSATLTFHAGSIRGAFPKLGKSTP